MAKSTSKKIVKNETSLETIQKNIIMKIKIAITNRQLDEFTPIAKESGMTVNLVIQESIKIYLGVSSIPHRELKNLKIKSPEKELKNTVISIELNNRHTKILEILTAEIDFFIVAEMSLAMVETFKSLPNKEQMEYANAYSHIGIYQDATTTIFFKKLIGIKNQPSKSI